MSDPITQSMIQGAAGAAAGEGEYIDNIFALDAKRMVSGSTNRYKNGVDLAGEGGWVWTKMRNISDWWYCTDTVQGATNYLATNTSGAQGSTSYIISQFHNDGFSYQDGYNTSANHHHAAWTFRKCPHFFDIVTYTGNETVREIAHNLGSVPGCIIIKNLSTAQDWIVYHRGIPDIGGTNARRARLSLNNTYGPQYSAFGEVWGNTDFTSTHFSLGTYQNCNKNGDSYVAYIFAHDTAKFGVRGNASVIKCGTYQGNGSSSGPRIDLGWEPQFFLIKGTNTENWHVLDTMRGLPDGEADKELQADTSNAELSWTDGGGNYLDVDATGATVGTSNGGVNASGAHYLYIAIRRSDGTVGKPPTAGTDAFAMDTWGSNMPTSGSGQGRRQMVSGNGNAQNTGGFPVDFVIDTDIQSSSGWQSNKNVRVRKLQNNYVMANATTALQQGTWGMFDYSDGWLNNQGMTGYTNWSSWMWKRGPGMDVVTYTGNGASINSVRHSLNAVPEMIWTKGLSAGTDNGVDRWKMYHKGANNGVDPLDYYTWIDSTDASASSGLSWSVSKTAFNPLNYGNPTYSNNVNNTKYLALLFASVEGISKVGHYTGNGGSSSQTITLGFQPRMVMIRASTSTGNFMLFDTVRGWGAGNDSAMNLNNQTSIYGMTFGEPTATGMNIDTTSADLNNNGIHYMYYAHA